MHWYEATVFLAFLSMALACRSLWRFVIEREAISRVAGAPGAGGTDAAKGLRRSLSTLSAFGESYLKRAGPGIERLLRRAGRPGSLTAREWVGLKVAGIICGILFTFLIALLGFSPVGMVAVFLLIVFGGFISPDLWLRYRASARHTEMVKDIPPFLETVGMVLKSGVPLESALERVSRNLGGPLGEEWGGTITAIKMRVPAADALRGLAERIASDDATMMVEVLLQADSLGVPIADTLHMQADFIRKAHRERGLERASKAIPKVTLITTLVSTPITWVFLLGMALVGAMQSGFSGLFGQ